MQGKKNLIPQMFYNVSLDEMVPEDDFYRKLNKTLDLHYLYKETKHYYGIEGQQSIDPVVFFKILIVGYLNNINSDRALMRFCNNCLNIRLFLGYDFNESMPFHSTISRTRQLLGEEVFLKLFQQILSMCVEKGMVSGKRQAIDSAFIKANASLDSLVEKEVLDDVAKYSSELEQNSEFKSTKPNDKSLHTVDSETKKAVEQHHNYKKEQHYADNKGYKGTKLDENGKPIVSKLLSNHTHYSPTDPDARISTKPGKPRNLNYFGQIGVDTKQHVITVAQADFADKRDSQCVETVTNQLVENLEQNNLLINQVLADTGYCSGESLKYFADNNIDTWMPLFGQYKVERDGFIYNKDLDRFECQRGNKAILPYKNSRSSKVGTNIYAQRHYRSSEAVCKNCPFRVECCGEKTKYKRISISENHEYYEAQHKKLTENEQYAKKMSRLRSSTVEPVLGCLINYFGLKKVYTRGIDLAQKHVLMSALSYNLQKLLKYNPRSRQVAVNAMFAEKTSVKNLIFGIFEPLLSSFLQFQSKILKFVKITVSCC